MNCIKTELSDIKDVEIAEEAIGKRCKFVLLIISKGKESKTILRALDLAYHQEIFDSVKDNLKLLNFNVAPNGGGWLFVDPNSKRIWIWGRSTVFGEFNLNKVKMLLKSNYKNYEILFEELDI